MHWKKNNIHLYVRGSGFVLVPLEKHISQCFTCQAVMIQEEENIDLTLHWLKPAISHKHKTIIVMEGQ